MSRKWKESKEKATKIRGSHNPRSGLFTVASIKARRMLQNIAKMTHWSSLLRGRNTYLTPLQTENIITTTELSQADLGGGLNYTHDLTG